MFEIGSADTNACDKRTGLSLEGEPDVDLISGEARSIGVIASVVGPFDTSEGALSDSLGEESCEIRVGVFRVAVPGRDEAEPGQVRFEIRLAIFVAICAKSKWTISREPIGGPPSQRRMRTRRYASISDPW